MWVKFPLQVIFNYGNQSALWLSEVSWEFYSYLYIFSSLFSKCHDKRKYYFSQSSRYNYLMIALAVKSLPANAGDIGTQVRSLGGEDPLEEEMAAHPSILAWRIPWTEAPGWLQSTDYGLWTQLKRFGIYVPIWLGNLTKDAENRYF